MAFKCAYVMLKDFIFARHNTRDFPALRNLEYSLKDVIHMPNMTNKDKCQNMSNSN